MRPGQFPAVPLGFEIFYADETVVRGRTPAEWTAAPSTGVQAVRVVVDKFYWRTHEGLGFVETHFAIRWAGHDYYWFDALASDASEIIKGGTAQEAPNRPPPGVLKTGTTVADDVWERIYGRVLADPPKPWSP